MIFENLYNNLTNSYPLMISGDCSINFPKTKNRLHIIHNSDYQQTPFGLELNFFNEEGKLLYSETSFSGGEDNYNISWSDNENFIAVTYISQWYEDLYFLDINQKRIIYEITGHKEIDGSRAVAFFRNKALILPTLNYESGLSDLKIFDCETLEEIILLKSEFLPLYGLICENFCVIDNLLVFISLQVFPGNIFAEVMTGTPEHDVISKQTIQLIDVQELITFRRLKLYSYNNSEIDYVLNKFQIHHIMKSQNNNLLLSYNNQIIEYNLNIAYHNYKTVELLEPFVLIGEWYKGYAIDSHTVSSYLLSDGTYDTTRSDIGELLYRFKYANNYDVLNTISNITIDFASKIFSGYGLGSWRHWTSEIDVIIPIPPTNHNREYQPVIELTKRISELSNVPCDLNYLQKKTHQELKSIDDNEQRKKILRNAFLIENQKYKGKTILLFDDIFRSGATLNAATQILKEKGKIDYIYVLTLTKTRTKR